MRRFIAILIGFTVWTASSSTTVLAQTYQYPSTSPAPQSSTPTTNSDMPKTQQAQPAAPTQPLQQSSSQKAGQATPSSNQKTSTLANTGPGDNWINLIAIVALVYFGLRYRSSKQALANSISGQSS